MKHLLVVAFAAFSPGLCAAASILGGEHDGFSRIVLTGLSAPIQSVTQDGRAVTITLSGPSETITDQGAMRKLSAGRITQVSTSGNSVRLTLGCDCVLLETGRTARQFVLDVKGSASAPVAHIRPKARPADREPVAQATAEVTQSSHHALDPQDPLFAWYALEQTAQSLAPTPTEKPAPAPPPSPTKDLDNVLREAIDRGTLVAGRTQHVSVGGDLTVSDNDSAPSRSSCLPPDLYDLAGWVNTTPFAERSAALLRDIAETETESAKIALAKVYIASGFGLEATQLLQSVTPPSPASQMLRAIGQLIDQSPGAALPVVDPYCPEAFSLWAVLSSGSLQNLSSAQRQAAAVDFLRLPKPLRHRLSDQLAAIYHDAGEAQFEQMILRGNTVRKAGAPAPVGLLGPRTEAQLAKAKALNGGDLTYIESLGVEMGDTAEGAHLVKIRFDAALEAHDWETAEEIIHSSMTSHSDAAAHRRRLLDAVTRSGSESDFLAVAFPATAADYDTPLRKRVSARLSDLGFGAAADSWSGTAAPAEQATPATAPVVRSSPPLPTPLAPGDLRLAEVRRLLESTEDLRSTVAAAISAPGPE